MVEELDLRACWGDVRCVGSGSKLRVWQVVDGEDVDCGWILGVFDDVDTVGDEGAVEAFQLQTGGLEGLTLIERACQYLALL
jgi:hypothetical protein